MALTTHLSGYVSSKVQGRGYSYYRIGAVHIINGNKDELQAFVFGSNRYKVNLYRKEDTIRASCTCPYFDENRATCKHIWATLLAGEKRGYLRGKGNSDPVRLKIDVEGDGWDDDEEGDWDEDEGLKEEDAIRPDYAMPSYSPRLTGKRHLRLVPPSLGWKDHLAPLREALQVREEEEKGRWQESRQILYFVDVSATVEGKGLVIEVAHREMKKNGEWGQLKSSADSYSKPEKMRDPMDQHIMALLLGSRDAVGYYYDSPLLETTSSKPLH